jgi:hypothetical protein
MVPAFGRHHHVDDRLHGAVDIGGEACSPIGRTRWVCSSAPSVASAPRPRSCFANLAYNMNRVQVADVKEITLTPGAHSEFITQIIMDAAREDCSRRAGTSLTGTQLFHRRLIGGIMIAFVGRDLPEQSGHLFVADGVGLIGEIHIHLRVFVVLAGHTVEQIGLV